MAKNLGQYNLFGSGKRGDKEVEERLEELVSKMQTPDNLDKMVKAISSSTRRVSQEQDSINLDFSKFEEKLNQAKKDYFGSNDSESGK